MRTSAALILANIGVVPLMTAFGGLNGDLLQYYAAGYFRLTGSEIGVALGLLVFTIPMQLLSTQLVRRWGCRRVLLSGFAVRFCLIPLLLIIPAVLESHRPMALGIFYVLVFTVHLVHVCTFGVAWQPLVRAAIEPARRGEYFGWMRFLFNGFNFAFFAVLGLSVGDVISAPEFTGIILFLMAYCAFAFAIVMRLDVQDDSIVAQPQLLEIVNQAKVLVGQPVYRALVVIGILRLPSTLPLFIVYLNIAVGLDAHEVSWILVVRAAGMMVGFLVWARVIRQYGYRAAVVWPLAMLVAVGPLWLAFADPWTPCRVLFAVIAMLTAFAHSGLGLGLVTAVHNTARTDNAVVVLTLFDIIDMGLESMAAALVGMYIAWMFGAVAESLPGVAFDPYMLFAMAGAAAAAIAFVTARTVIPRIS